MKHKGFTYVEILIGSSIMLIIIMLSLTLYTKSSKAAVDQMQLAEIQHDVRSAMYFISRNVRNTGVGLAIIPGYSIEGIDSYSPAPQFADAVKLMGCFDDPLDLTIKKYQGGEGGAASTVFLHDWQLGQIPYPAEFFTDKTVLIISTICPGCFALRSITQAFGLDGLGIAKLSIVPGQAIINPPGGLVEIGCSVDCWQDGKVKFGQVMLYWLDTSGDPTDYPDLNLNIGVNGYLGIPNTFYMTIATGHMAIAQNIENFQLQYYGDLDNDGNLDLSADWDNINWTITPSDDVAVRLEKRNLISRIGGVRIWMLGKTPNPFISRSGSPPASLHLYRRPIIANSPASTDDNHRRFLIETTSSIRNNNLNLY